MPHKLLKNKEFFDQQFNEMKQNLVDDSQDAVQELEKQSKNVFSHSFILYSLFH